VAALYIASRGWREAAAERSDRDAAQARQVVMRDQRSSTIEITNYSTAPVLHVEVQSVFRAAGLSLQLTEQLVTRPRGGDARGVRTVLDPRESLSVDILTPVGR